LNSFRTSYC